MSVTFFKALRSGELSYDISSYSGVLSVGRHEIHEIRSYDASDPVIYTLNRQNEFRPVSLDEETLNSKRLLSPEEAVQETVSYRKVRDSFKKLQMYYLNAAEMYEKDGFSIFSYYELADMQSGTVPPCETWNTFGLLIDEIPDVCIIFSLSPEGICVNRILDRYSVETEDEIQPEWTFEDVLHYLYRIRVSEDTILRLTEEYKEALNTPVEGIYRAKEVSSYALKTDAQMRASVLYVSCPSCGTRVLDNIHTVQKGIVPCPYCSRKVSLSPVKAEDEKTGIYKVRRMISFITPDDKKDFLLKQSGPDFDTEYEAKMYLYQHPSLIHNGYKAEKVS